MTEAGTLPLTVATVEVVEEPTFDDFMESDPTTARRCSRFCGSARKGGVGFQPASCEPWVSDSTYPRHSSKA